MYCPGSMAQEMLAKFYLNLFEEMLVKARGIDHDIACIPDYQV